MSNKRTGRMPPKHAEAVAQRSGGMCEVCHVMPANDIHHRRFLGRGGRHNIANLLHVCGNGNIDGCHGRAHTGAHLDGTAISTWWPLAEADTGFTDLLGQVWLIDDHGGKELQRDGGDS